MLYVAGEIFLWMLLAFALGVLVGWFVWGVRQRKVATTKEALAAAPGHTAASSDIESVTVRPVVRVQAPPEPADQLPVTPPAGTPVVVAAAVSEAPGPTEPATTETPAVVAEPAASTEPERQPEPEPVPSDDAVTAAAEPDLVAGSPALASLVSDESPGEPVATGSDPAPTPAAGSAASSGNLQVVEGLEPAIEAVLKESGITSLDDLAATTPDRLRTLLDLAGDQYRAHDPDSWPHQAQLASAGRWDELAALQATLGDTPSG